MSTTHEVESEGISWEGKACGFTVEGPKWIGLKTPAELRRGAENTLVLDTKYCPPFNPWLTLLAVVAFIAIVVATTLSLKDDSLSTILDVGAGCVGAAIFLSVRSWRQREIELDLGTAASEAIVDEQRCRVAFLAPIDDKARWIALELEDDFSEASGAVREVMGAKCRTGRISGVDKVFVVVILAIVVLFVAAFGYLMLKAALIPAPK